MFCTFNGILTSFWDEEIMPQEFKDATIISIFKNKADYKAGNKADCGNYRDISFLSVAGKNLARMILNRLNNSIF